MRRPILIALGGVAALLAVTLALLMVGGFSAPRALEALWTGSIGSWYAFTSGTLVRAVPLLLTGCAVAVAFRAGVFNIGAEGQFIAGTIAASALALQLPGWGVAGLALAVLGGCVAGALWAGIAAELRLRFGVLEVISTIMLNFVALHALSYLVRGPLQEPTHIYPQTSTFADGVRLAHLPGAGRLHAGLLIAVAVLGTAGWVLRHTAFGFRLLAIGDSPAAARSAGLIDVSRTTRAAFLWSGAIAGLAGAIEVLGVTFALYENISPGYGYTAIAVALLAGLDPWRVVVSAVLFAALEAGAGAMQRDAGVPATLVSVIEALLILGVVGAQAVRWQLRRADAIPVAAPEASA
ncbi:MAG: ABC transporter permease [bacterium]